MWAVLLLTAMAAGGEVMTFRPPVNGYAGLNFSGRQAVLVEPTSSPPSRTPSATTPQPQLTPQGDEENSASPTAASLAQKLRLGRPKYSRRPLNRSSPLLHRLRQQFAGKRIGNWRKAAGGLTSRRMRPGVSRLAGGSGKVIKRRRRPGGSMGSAGQMRTISGILRHRLAMPATTTDQSNDYSNHRQNSYSSNPVNGTENRVILTSERRNESANSDYVPGQSIERPDVPDSLSPVRPPSVHDMTSMHYSDKNTVSIRHNIRKKILPKQNIKESSPAAVLPPGDTAKDDTKSSDEKEIFGSVQSIFQAVKSDEGELASMKTVSHGNAAPQPLDIFSGVSPTYGFQPSLLLPSSKPDGQNSQTQISPSTFEGSPGPKLLTSNDMFSASETAPEPILAVPQELQTGDFVVHVGRPLPVTSGSVDGEPEYRQVEDGDILLAEGEDNIIVGQPAALIQAPPEETSSPLFNDPLPFTHPTNTHHFHSSHESPPQHYQSEPSPSAYNQDNLEPLLEYIKTKYMPERIPNIPKSVSSLQSIIQSGRVPQIFRREEVMQHIQNDQHRFRRPLVNRLGRPMPTSVDRVHTRPQMKTDTGGTGQFVALSSLALLAALCGYLIFASPGSSLQTKVVDPIKEAVEEARSGLNLILQGLDEYENYLDKGKNMNDKVRLENEHSEEEKEPKEDIPTILTKIITKVVPPEVIVSSEPSSGLQGERHLVSASDLVRGHKKITSGFRQPHAMVIHTTPLITDSDVDAELSRINATLTSSIMRTTARLSSVAASFVNNFINSKTVRKIISQLKNQTVSARWETNHLQLPKSNSSHKLSSENLKAAVSFSKDNPHKTGMATKTEKIGVEEELLDDRYANPEKVSESATEMKPMTENTGETKMKDTQEEMFRNDATPQNNVKKATQPIQATETPELVTFIRIDSVKETETKENTKKETDKKHSTQTGNKKGENTNEEEKPDATELNDKNIANTKKDRLDMAKESKEKISMSNIKSTVNGNSDETDKNRQKDRHQNLFTTKPSTPSTSNTRNLTTSLSSSIIKPNNDNYDLPTTTAPSNGSKIHPPTSTTASNKQKPALPRTTVPSNNKLDLPSTTTSTTIFNSQATTPTPPATTRNDDNHNLATTSEPKSSASKHSNHDPQATPAPSTATRNSTHNPTTTPQPTTSGNSKKLVILNNLLHIQHNPETDQPRTSAFLNNIPLRPVSQTPART